MERKEQVVAHWWAMRKITLQDRPEVEIDGRLGEMEEVEVEEEDAAGDEDD